MPSPTSQPKLILFEDEHLLVINKPPGINTHSASKYSSEGIYDWLRNRNPQWSSLAIHQRLDGETSGVLVFGKTRAANQSLAHQFEQRSIEKHYHLLTDQTAVKILDLVESRIAKLAGGTFRSVDGSHGHTAQTLFKPLGESNGRRLIEARPLTGRTHQIRIHARDAGFPILGDQLYEGSPFQRLCLHSHSLSVAHPVSGKRLTIVAPIDFEQDPRVWLRQSLWVEPQTNAWRLVHGSSDGFPTWYVDRLGDYLLSQSEDELDGSKRQQLDSWIDDLGLKGSYHKTLDRKVRQSNPDSASPKLIGGEEAPARFEIMENGIRYSIRFQEGYSVGLFLDQKDNRNRLLTGHFFPKSKPNPETPGFRATSRQGKDTHTREEGLSGKSVLNTFAYTCGFSVCAAISEATVTSLDLSKKYLEWGKDNFRLNGLDPEQHDFIYGDCFNWMKRLAKKGRQFDMILLDPPTFSKSKESGIFKADKHFGRLVRDALSLLVPDGILFASTNCATLRPDELLATIHQSITESDRRVIEEFYAPQPPDFPTSSLEPPYLKTVWLRVL